MIIQHQTQPQLSMGHDHQHNDQQQQLPTVDDSSVASKADHPPPGIAIQHSSSSSGSSSNSATATATTVGAQLQIPPQQESKLMESLRKQVEFYFSPLNYANDTYLQQYSAAYAGSVPLSVIASFPKVQELFAGANLSHLHAAMMMNPPAEIQLLAQAMQASDMLVVSSDGIWITPLRPILLAAPAAVTPGLQQLRSISTTNNHNMLPHQIMVPPSSQDTTETSSQQSTSATAPSSSKERTTIIVRDLPLECDEGDVMNAFTTESNSPKSARLDVGNTWYVQFESESQALEALAASQHRLIDGQPLKARLKSELSAPTAMTKGETNHPHHYGAAITHHHHQQQHPHYTVAAMPQHHYNHHYGGGMHHQPSYAVMPHNIYHANQMSYGMAAIYPMNTHHQTPFYMDHPQHLMPPMMSSQQMSYAMSSSDSGSQKHKNNNNKQKQHRNHHANYQSQAGAPDHVYVHNYQQLNNSNNNNNNERGNNHYNNNNNNQSNSTNPKEKTKNTNRKNKNKKKNSNNNNNNNVNGERRMEQQALSRGGEGPMNGDLFPKERREQPSQLPPTGSKDISVQGSDSFQSDQQGNGNVNAQIRGNKKTKQLTKKSLNHFNKNIPINNNNSRDIDDTNNKNNPINNNNATNGKKKRPLTSSKGKKKSQHQRSTSMSSTASSSKILNEDFPALTPTGGGGGMKPASKQRGGPDKVGPQRAAYAEALLKPCTKKTTTALDSATDDIQAAFEQITTEENQQYEDAMCW